MAHDTPNFTFFTVRMGRPMAERVREVARAEGNTASAVLRRLIAQGLAQERPWSSSEPRTPEGSA